jgi:hypothetical protein
MCLQSFMIRTMHAFLCAPSVPSSTVIESYTHVCPIATFLFEAVLRLLALFAALDTRHDDCVG